MSFKKHWQQARGRSLLSEKFDAPCSGLLACLVSALPESGFLNPVSCVAHAFYISLQVALLLGFNMEWHYIPDQIKAALKVACSVWLLLLIAFDVLTCHTASSAEFEVSHTVKHTSPQLLPVVNRCAEIDMCRNFMFHISKTPYIATPVRAASCPTRDEKS